MDERILIISNEKRDVELFEGILGSKGFDIEAISLSDEIEETNLKDAYAVILADYDLIGNRSYSWINILQENRSQSCFILYGEKIKSDKTSEMLQKGIYGFVPRSFLSERIYDTILGGLENRKAFIEILGMIDELKVVNKRLKREKENFRTKNQELGFINRLSSEVAYDLDWDGILPRILDAGLLKVIDVELFSILYRIDSKWNLALSLSEKEINKKTLERLKRNIVDRYFTLSKESILIKEMTFYLYPSNLPVLCAARQTGVKVSSSSPLSFSKPWILPLSLAGKPLGMLVILPKNKEELKKGKKELMSTISNILAMSLKNAQAYNKLKNMAVTDGLTGIYNHKALGEFIQQEFQRARRYNKPLSLVMIDVDGFKDINDSLGHQAGDYVLRELARCLKSAVRNTDILARYGGDEFAILLPETDMRKAEVLVKRMLHSVRNHTFKWRSERIRVEISCGISNIGELEERENEEEFIYRADSRLYIAKQSRELFYSVPAEA
ncbi:MAG: GGDEF domain-containing protein [Deltaproteobacteria bacterium]|nr:GGDEF domain-containing protein [Deltaproteobacteria bacterium]